MSYSKYFYILYIYTNIPRKMNRIARKTRKHKWSLKYKRSINCKHPKGFSQRQHCKYGRKNWTKKR